MVHEWTGKQASISDIHINPFNFSVRLLGFELNASDGSHVLGFDDLFVDLDLSSFGDKALRFKEVRLIRPSLRVEIGADGKFNVSELMPETETGAGIERDGDPIEIYINRLRIKNGEFELEDRSKITPFRETISSLDIAIDQFATGVEQSADFSLHAVLDSGGSLQFDGKVSVNPLQSHGRIRLVDVTCRPVFKYVRALMKFQITDGRFDLATNYRLDTSRGNVDFEIVNGRYRLRDFNLLEPGESVPLIAIPKVAVDGIDINVMERSIKIESIFSKAGAVKAWLLPDGSINYASRFQNQKDGNNQAESESQTAADSSWLVGINQIRINDYKVDFTDQSKDKPLELSLSAVNLSIDDFSTRLGNKFTLSLDSKLNETGAIHADGAVSIQPVATNLNFDLKGVELNSFQSYLDSYPNLELNSGVLNAGGTLHYGESAGGKVAWNYSGAVGIDGLKASDINSGKEVVVWKGLKLNGVSVQTEPLRFKTEEILVDTPYVRAIIESDGSFNLKQTFTQSDQPGENNKDSRNTEIIDDPLLIEIRKIKLSNGFAKFADYSITPSFATNMHSLNGTIKGLSSMPDARADIEIKGTVDRYGKVAIDGQFSPFAEKLYSDIGLQFKNIDMTSLTAYSGKFAGYRVNQGKLALELDYRIENNQLTAENSIVLDQLSLGEYVDSPHATSLPVRLAIALLKDYNGLIQVDLPIRGNLDDPEFDIGDLVGKALLNLVAKAATSPFALIGELVDSISEELEYVSFDPGDSELNQQQIEKLDKIAAALSKRPDLNIEIGGIADSRIDQNALAKKGLEEKIKAEKIAEMEINDQSASKFANITITNEDRRRLLVRLYLRTVAVVAESVLFNENSQLTEMLESDDFIRLATNRLVSRIDVRQEQLRWLARKRADQIRQYLVEQAKLSEQRVYLRGVQVESGKQTGNTVRTLLSLVVS